MGKKFKKFIATSIVVLAGTIFMSCGEKNFRVSFNLNGGSAVESQVVLENGLVAAPTNPTKENAIFAGWFKDSACTIPWNFNEDKVTADTVIFAKWIEESSITVPATTLDNDGYTLSVVGGASTVPINGSFELTLEVNTEKFITDNFALVRNGNSVTTPETFAEETGKKIYTYSFSGVVENQEFSVIGLVPKFYIATFDASEFYTISDIEGTRSSINYGEDYSFRVNLLEGYTDSVATMSVWNGQTRIYPDSNRIYTIENVTSNFKITIENIYKNIYTVSYPESLVDNARFEVVEGADTIFHGEDLTFKVRLADKYSKTKVNELIDIKIAGISVSSTHTFDNATRTYTITIPANKVKGNINISLDDTNWQLDKYIVAFPSEMVGYNLTSNYASIGNGQFEVNYGGKFEFYVELEEDYKYCQTFKLMVGNLDSTLGLYGTTDNKVTVEGITQDYEIRIENLTRNSYTIEVPEDAGYEIILADGYSLPVEEGSEIKFDIRVLDENGYEQTSPDLPLPTYTIAYYDNPYVAGDEEAGEVSAPVTIYKNGYYTIPSVNGNIKLNVTGIAKKEFTTSISADSGFIVENLPNTLTFGETYTFDVIVDDEYLDSLTNGEIRANINGKVLTYKNNFAENKITFTIIVNNNLLSYLGSSKVVPIEITGVAKNYFNVTFSLNTSRVSGGYFENYEALGEGYTENSYTISVKRGESAVAPDKSNIIAPAHYKLNPYRTWLSEFDEITSDMTIYVDFIPIDYSILFELNGGTNSPQNNTSGGMTSSKYIYNIETPIKLVDPTKEITENSGIYYDFLGWFLEEDGKLINIEDFTGLKNITVSASWGIKVGENETRKTIAEAISVANSGDKIVVLESATLGSQPSISNKELEIIGENENVSIEVSGVSNLSGSLSEGYYLFNVSNSNNFSISNIDFVLEESISSNVMLFNIVNSNIEATELNLTNMSLMKAYSTADKTILIDNVSVSNNKNYYAVMSYATENSNQLIIKNSTFNVFKGVLVGTSNIYLGKQKVTLANNTFRQVALKEEIEGEFAIDIKFTGVHDIQTISNTHNSALTNGEYIIFENILEDVLVKENIENLISKISVVLENESISKPINLYTMKDVTIGTDDVNGPIWETRKTNQVLYDFVNGTYSTTIYYGTEEDVEKALEFTDVLNIELDESVEIGDIIEIKGAIEIPEIVELWVKSGTINITETGALNVSGILNFAGNISNFGTITIGTNGEIVNGKNIKLGTSYETGSVTSELELNLSSGTTGTIEGHVVEASKTSIVYSYYKDVQNATFHFVSFQVYVGIEKAGTTLNDIVISNENGLLYTTGTNTSAQLTDIVNENGYIDVILDANVIDGTANLSKATISFGGNSYVVNISVAPYVPEILADQSFAMGYLYGTYLSNGIGTAHIFNTYQTIEENKDETLTSEKDNFSKLIASGALVEVVTGSNVDNIAPETSSNHFVTFRQYVGLQYAGAYVAETYVANGVESEEILNIHVLGQNANNKNKVDKEGYLHYIFDANVSYLSNNGIWLYEKVNLETIQVFFTLDSETYEIRVDIQDMQVYNRSNRLDVMLGNMVDIGIENRWNTLTYSNEKYTISGRVYKVGETEEIKNNQTFYDGANNAKGYFVAYRVFTSKEDGQLKPLIGKAVTVSTSGYAGRTWCGGVVLANGYIEFITELLESDGIIQEGELTLTYQVEGEEEKTIIIALSNLEIIEDKSSREFAIKVEDFVVNGTGTGVDISNYSITPVGAGSYKVESAAFFSTNLNAEAYNNPYAEENSTGYFVVFTAFAGMRAWGDVIDVTLSYQKDGSEVKTETRELEVNLNGYIGIFVDTLTVGTELGLDTLTITFKNVDNEGVTYVLDFSEVVVVEYETE